MKNADIITHYVCELGTMTHFHLMFIFYQHFKKMQYRILNY